MTELPVAARERLLAVLRLLEHSDGGIFSSAELEALTGWPGHTIRKDISYLDVEQAGEKSGRGYSRERLVPVIRRALGLDRRRKFCVAGLGRLGSAFLGQDWNGGSGEFELAAGFDVNVNRVEILKSSTPLFPAYKMAEVIGRLGIDIALLCVPAPAAQSCAEKLCTAGIKGIVNFAPAALVVPPGIPVENVYLADGLRSLAVKMHCAQARTGTP